ncbi:MAG: pilus assembly protein [Bdellovibrionota bacterium]
MAYKNSIRKSARNRGAILIEFAITFPVLIFIFLAGHEVMQINRAYESPSYRRCSTDACIINCTSIWADRLDAKKMASNPGGLLWTRDDQNEVRVYCKQVIQI